MKKTTLQDVANHCGVSLAAASRAINGAPRVSDAVRKLVLAAADQLNYRNRCVMGRKSVAFLLEPAMNLTDIYSYLIMSAIYNRLAREKYFFQAVNSTSIVDLHSFSAVITISPVNKWISSWGEEFGIPMIAVNTPGNGRDNIYSVCSDERKAMEDAIAELYAKGHRRIGLQIASGLETWCMNNRIAGFQESMLRRGLPVDGFIEAGYVDEETYSYKTLGKLLGKGITALISPGEGLGQRMIHILKQFGYRIPEDLSLIAWEAPGISEYNQPPLTTMEQDFNGIADRIFTILTALQEGKFIGSDHVVDYRFNRRDSVSGPEKRSPAKQFAPDGA